MILSKNSDLYSVFDQYAHSGKLAFVDLQGAANNFHVYLPSSFLPEIPSLFANDEVSGLSFHQFCLIVACSRLLLDPESNVKSTYKRWDVFLGGACNPTTWRTDTAIPYLDSEHISYYNPQLETWSPELMELEQQAKFSSHVLLFVFERWKTRGLASLVEAAYLTGMNANLVLVVPPDSAVDVPVISNEELSQFEYFCLQQALFLLVSLVKRHGLPVFTNLTEALNCVAYLVRNNLPATAATENSDASSKLSAMICNVQNAFAELLPNVDGYVPKEKAECALQRLLDNSAVNLQQFEQNSGQKLITFADFTLAFAERVFKRAPLQNMSKSSPISHSTDKQLGAVHTTQPKSVRYKDFWHQVAQIAAGFQEVEEEEALPIMRAAHEKGTAMVRSRLERRLSSPMSSQIESVGSLTTRPTTWSPCSFDLYLGGACTLGASGKDSWLETLAIPRLQQYSYIYASPPTCPTLNPLSSSNLQTADVVTCEQPDNGLATQLEQALANSRLLLYVITSQAFNLLAIVEAAYAIGCGRQVVLCVQNFPTEGFQATTTGASDHAPFCCSTTAATHTASHAVTDSLTSNCTPCSASSIPINGRKSNRRSTEIVDHNDSPSETISSPLDASPVQAGSPCSDLTPHACQSAKNIELTAQLSNESSVGLSSLSSSVSHDSAVFHTKYPPFTSLNVDSKPESVDSGIDVKQLCTSSSAATKLASSGGSAQLSTCSDLNWDVAQLLAISPSAARDHNRSRAYLVDLARRLQIPVTSDIGEALEISLSCLAR